MIIDSYNDLVDRYLLVGTICLMNLPLNCENVEHKNVENKKKFGQNSLEKS